MIVPDGVTVNFGNNTYGPGSSIPDDVAAKLGITAPAQSTKAAPAPQSAPAAQTSSSGGS